MKFVFALLILVCINLNCGSAPSPQDSSVLLDVPVTPVWEDPTAGMDSARLVIQSEGELRRLWSDALINKNFAGVDFTAQTLLVASAGERPGHAWRIEITRARIIRDTLHVFVRELIGCATTGMQIRPIAVVAVPKLQIPVRFQDVGDWQEVCR
jgi:hypothetical protein